MACQGHRSQKSARMRPGQAIYAATQERYDSHNYRNKICNKWLSNQAAPAAPKCSAHPRARTAHCSAVDKRFNGETERAPDEKLSSFSSDAFFPNELNCKADDWKEMSGELPDKNDEALYLPQYHDNPKENTVKVTDCSHDKRHVSGAHSNRCYSSGRLANVAEMGDHGADGLAGNNDSEFELSNGSQHMEAIEKTRDKRLWTRNIQKDIRFNTIDTDYDQDFAYNQRSLSHLNEMPKNRQNVVHGKAEHVPSRKCFKYKSAVRSNGGNERKEPAFQMTDFESAAEPMQLVPSKSKTDSSMIERSTMHPPRPPIINVSFKNLYIIRDPLKK